MREEMSKIREGCIAIMLLVQDGYPEGINEGKEEAKDLLSADDADVLIHEVKREEVFNVMNRFSSCRLPLGISCQDDILSIGERLAKGVECFSSHDDGMACRDFFEDFKVFRDVPRDTSILTDDVTGRHGDDCRKRESSIGFCC